MEAPELVCEECGVTASGAGVSRGWRAYWTDDEPPEVVSFCPACVAREFADDAEAGGTE